MSEEIKEETIADVADGGHSSSVDGVGGIVEGMDIAEVLSSAGPVVKCVILRAKTTTTTTTKPLEQQKNDGGVGGGGDDNDDDDDVEQKSATIHCQKKSSLPIVLTNLIDEIDIDTTPSKSMVSKVLGGPFTFLGQYEDEGIVLMVRNLPEDILQLVGEVKSSSSDCSGDDGNNNNDDNNNNNNNNQTTTTIITITSLLKEKKLSELKGFCKELDIDMTGMIEKSDVVQGIVSRIPPINPHRLQPPLHEAVACGDIICMRVAETNEELDDDFDDDDDDDEEEEEEEEEEEKEEGESEQQDTTPGAAAATTTTTTSTSNDNDDTGTSPPPPPPPAATKKKLHVPSNDEFFLNYTKEEYIKFASRRDIDENDINSSDVAAEDSEERKQEGGREGEINNDGGVGDDDDGEQVEDEGNPLEQAVDHPDDYIDDPDADTGTDPSARGVYVLGGDETIDEEDKSAMFNLVMNEVLRQYREENGRGPNTQELLELRATIAKELDVEVAHVEDSDWDKKAKENSVPTGKKIGFHDEDKVLEFQPHENEHNHHQHYMDLPESVMNGQHDYDDDDDNNDDEENENENYEPPNKRYKRDPNNDDDDYDYDDDDNGAKKPAAKEKDTETVETKTPAPVTNGNGNGNGILKMPPPSAAAASASREGGEAIDTEDTANNTFAAASTSTLGSPGW